MSGAPGRTFSRKTSTHLPRGREDSHEGSRTTRLSGGAAEPWSQNDHRLFLLQGRLRGHDGSNHTNNLDFTLDTESSSTRESDEDKIPLGDPRLPALRSPTERSRTVLSTLVSSARKIVKRGRKGDQESFCRNGLGLQKKDVYK